METPRKITISEIEEYLYCPLKYRYHKIFEVPDNKLPYDIILSYVAQATVASYFTSLGRGHSSTTARNRIATVLRKMWESRGGKPEKFVLSHTQIMLLLVEILKVFSREKDVPVGGNIISSIVSNNILVEDTIEAMFIKNDKKREKGPREIGLIQIQADSVTPNTKVGELRRAIARYTMNTVLMKRLPIKLTVISVPSLKKKVYDILSSDYNEARMLIHSVVKHIRNDMYLPTDDPLRCKNCPYNTICSNNFCASQVSRGIIRAANIKLRSD